MQNQTRCLAARPRKAHDLGLGARAPRPCARTSVSVTLPMAMLDNTGRSYCTMLVGRAATRAHSHLPMASYERCTCEFHALKMSSRSRRSSKLGTASKRCAWEGGDKHGE